MSGNPILRIDLLGNTDDLYIQGDNSDAAVQELQKGTTMTINRDEATGRISLEGVPSNDRDRALASVVDDNTVSVVVHTVENRDNLNGVGFTGGGWAGMKLSDESLTAPINNKPFEAEEFEFQHVESIQYVNLAVLSQFDAIGEVSRGHHLTHEILQAYHAGEISQKMGLPAGDYTLTKRDKSIYQMSKSKLNQTRFDQAVSFPSWYGEHVPVVEVMKNGSSEIYNVDRKNGKIK